MGPQEAPCPVHAPPPTPWDGAQLGSVRLVVGFFFYYYFTFNILILVSPYKSPHRAAL